MEIRRLRRSVMIGIISVLAVAYALIVVFSFISEFTYKKHTFAEVKKDSKQILFKSTLGFAILVASAFLYYLLGIGTE